MSGLVTLLEEPLGLHDIAGPASPWQPLFLLLVSSKHGLHPVGPWLCHAPNSLLNKQSCTCQSLSLRKAHIKGGKG